MNDIIETIPQAGKKRQRSEIRLATVAEVLTNGLKLRFDGSDAATSKIYKCNSSCSFSVGDRVKVTKCSGTYVVDYVIGGPSSGGGGGGTTNYNDLSNKPSINGVTLSGNKTAADLYLPSTKEDIGLGNVDNVRQYSASNPPPYPVLSVNGMTGNVIVEENTSAAGYCKMPDGTLICWGEFTVLRDTQWSSPSSFGQMYTCNAQNLGVSFAYPFLTNSSIACVVNTKDQALAILLADSDYSGISRIFVLRHVNSKPPDTVFSYIATGRWKA